MIHEEAYYQFYVPLPLPFTHTYVGITKFAVAHDCLEDENSSLPGSLTTRMVGEDHSYVLVGGWPRSEYELDKRPGAGVVKVVVQTMLRRWICCRDAKTTCL